MRINSLVLLSVILLLTIVFLAGCDKDDDTTTSHTGTLSGKVILYGAWPDSGTVQLSVFSNWTVTTCSWCATTAGGPPAYHTAASWIQDPDTTNGNGPDTVAYSISGITLGTYAAVAVGWRRPHGTGNVNTDEPVLGFWGANPNTIDSIPEPISFSESQPVLSDVNVQAYFSMIPAQAGPDTLGLLGGVVRVDGQWPTSRLTVLMTTYPFTPWMAPGPTPPTYDFLDNAADSIFSFSPYFGSYYLSVWVGQQANAKWLGSYGVNLQTRDIRPDVSTISSSEPVSFGKIINADAVPPHWISGNITFNGTRPTEGLLALLSTFPYSPEHAPTGAPSGYFPITDPSETLYAFTRMTEGTYYVSLWNNVQPPAVPTFYGAYGYTAGSDPDPAPVTISTAIWGENSVNIVGQP